MIFTSNLVLESLRSLSNFLPLLFDSFLQLAQVDLVVSVPDAMQRVVNADVVLIKHNIHDIKTLTVRQMNGNDKPKHTTSMATVFIKHYQDDHINKI